MEGGRNENRRTDGGEIKSVFGVYLSLLFLGSVQVKLCNRPPKKLYRLLLMLNSTLKMSLKIQFLGSIKPKEI